MSTIQVDRIIPYQSSSVTIEGDVTFAGAVSTGSFNTYTASNDQRVSSLESFTSSQEVINSNLESTTASLETSVSNLNGFTASQETLNSGFATTGSNTFSGTQIVNGTITANGNLQSVGNPNTILDIYSNGGNYDTFAVQVLQNSGSIVYDYDVVGNANNTWLQIPTNTGNNPKPIFARGLVVSGSVEVSGSVKQTFAQPSNAQLALNTVAGTFTIPSTGAPYNYVENSFAGYGFGNAYNGWLWESWDSLSFNYGSDTSINASGFYAYVQPSGSSNAFSGELRVRDNYNGTTLAYMYATEIALGSQKTNRLEIGNSDLTSVISGSVSVEKILTLAPQDPLPSGAVGQVAVSGSNLYFYTDQWREVAFV